MQKLTSFLILVSLFSCDGFSRHPRIGICDQQSKYYDLAKCQSILEVIDVAVTVSSTSVYISWNEPISGAFDGVRILSKASDTFSGATDAAATVVCDPCMSPITDVIGENATHYYRLFGYSNLDSGDLIYSQGVSVVTITPKDFSVIVHGGGQIIGKPFDVTITARDNGGATVTNFVGSATITANQGDVILNSDTRSSDTLGIVPMPPAAVVSGFANGVVTQTIVLNAKATTLTVNADSIIGVSSTFTTLHSSFGNQALSVNLGFSPHGVGQAMYPTVIEDGSQYKMWYTGQTGATQRIIYAVSNNGGLLWETPQLAIDTGGAPGGYDSVHCYSPKVIKDSSLYRMWYSGSNGSASRIIYAESNDGINWTNKQLAVDIGLFPEGYDSAHVEMPTVIKDGSIYKMWYVGSNGSNQRILYAESNDGKVNWINNRQLSVNIGSSPNGDDSGGALTPTVIKDGNRYRLWYTGSGSSQLQILYAESSNGKLWNNFQTVLGVGTEPTGYDSDRVYFPCILKDGDIYKLWYTGWDGSNNRILYAETQP